MSASLSALATCVVHWSLLRALLDELDACVAVQQMLWRYWRAIRAREICTKAASVRGRWKAANARSLPQMQPSRRNAKLVPDWSIDLAFIDTS